MSIRIKDLKEHQVVYAGQPNLRSDGYDSDILKLTVIKRRFYLKEDCRYDFLTNGPKPYLKLGNNGLPKGFYHRISVDDLPYSSHFLLTHMETEKPHFYIMGRQYIYVTEITLQDDCGDTYVITDKDKDANGMDLKSTAFRLFRKPKQARAWSKRIFPNQEYLVGLAEVATYVQADE